MTRAVELCSRAKTRRARTDNGNLFAGSFFRRLRQDPTRLPTFVDDRAFQVLNRNRRRVNSENARALAGSGANATGKVGKIVGFVQPFESFFPQPAVNEIVPFRNQVMDGATGSHSIEERARVAEGNA